jgi:DNA-binding NarL/FixJ family response regulator
MKKISILIVDDHKLLRETWKQILNSELSFEVVADCGTAEEALNLAEKFQPEIILLDINLPGMNGVQAASLLLKSSPTSKILGVSMHTQPAYAKQLMKNGAFGYITKNASRQEMIHAIKEVLLGKKYVCQNIRDILAQQMLIDDEDDKGINSLSLREMEVINLLKQGRSSKEIAQALFISVKTVEVHRYNILKKLKLTNTAALINYINKKYSGEN